MELARLIAESLDQGDDMVAWFTPEGHIIYANDAYVSRVGYTLEELLSLSVYDVNPQAPSLYGEHWQEIKARGSMTFESSHRTRSGEVYPVKIIAKYLCRGSLECNATITRDIGPQKQTEEQLRLILFAVDEATDLVSWLDHEGRFVYVNKSMGRRLGYERDELIGRHVREVAPATPGQWDGYWQKLKTHGSLTSSASYRTRDGKTVPVESIVTHVVYEGSEYSLGISRDISDRMRQEREAQLIARAIDTAGLGVLRVDREGRLLDVNAYLCRTLGYSLKELLGMYIFDIVEGFDACDWPARWEELWALGQTTFERDYRTRDGLLIPMEVQTTSTVTGTGEEESIHAFMRNLSEYKRAESLLREREEQLRQAQRLEAIGLLAGGIAHDFNNLLTTILGYSDLLLAAGELAGSPGEEDLKEIKSAAERAASLTSRILAFSRRQALKPEVVLLDEVINDALPFIQRTLGADIEVVIQLADDSRPVEVDPHQFMQVLMNLAINARDAMPAGGKLLVQTEVVDLDERTARLIDRDLVAGIYAKMTVSDTGIGIEPEHLPRIFDPFFTTKGPQEGTGLGLATAHGTIKQSGGTIKVESTPGRGARFSILLPQTEREVTTHILHKKSEITMAPIQWKILLVEDEEPVRNLVERVLEGLGCTAYTASTGAQAVVMIQSGEFPIDLLITDVVLPGALYGTDIARLAAERVDDLAVLLISGYAQDLTFDEANRSEDIHFLQKPFTPDQLAAEVRELLERRSRTVLQTH